jgi:hypothetical protein
VHICLVAPNDFFADPRALVTDYVLRRAAHRVSVVLPGTGQSEGDVHFVPTPHPPKRRRFRPRPVPDPRTRRMDAIAEAAAATGASLFVPTDARALEPAIGGARATGGAVLRTPKMDPADGFDLIDIAPSRPELAMPPAGLGDFHTPADVRPPSSPKAGRHRDRKIVLCYRRSEINPGRYLEEGIRRSGANLRVETEGIDLATVDPDTDFVLFVEAPYPALDVTGNTEVPVLFWFHHGEHHLYANLRLADRYRADAILMAHSWHLAPFAHLPVHRFPFGVATELLDPSRRLADRTYDIAMVGAKLWGGGPYARRQQLVAALEGAFPKERLGFRENVLAHEMAALYGDSRIVINEGGTRHYPITMRVLETVGSGAVLLSDRLPGMEMLLQEDTHYAVMSEDVVADVGELLADPDRLQAMADGALETAMARHTYDHRVDELFEIAANTVKRERTKPPERSPLASVIDADVEVQRVGHLDLGDLAEELPDREVWDTARMDASRLAPGKMETVAIRSGDVTGSLDLLRAARRYLYIEGEARGLDDYLESEQPQAAVTRIGGVIRVDLMAPSYRIMPFEGASP